MTRTEDSERESPSWVEIKSNALPATMDCSADDERPSCRLPSTSLTLWNHNVFSWTGLSCVFTVTWSRWFNGTDLALSFGSPGSARCRIFISWTFWNCAIFFGFVGAFWDGKDTGIFFDVEGNFAASIVCTMLLSDGGLVSCTGQEWLAECRCLKMECKMHRKNLRVYAILTWHSMRDGNRDKRQDFCRLHPQAAHP